MKKYLILTIDDDNFYYVIVELNQSFINAYLNSDLERNKLRALSLELESKNLEINPIGLPIKSISGLDDLYSILIDRLDNSYIDSEIIAEDDEFYVIDSDILFDDKVKFDLCIKNGEQHFNTLINREGLLFRNDNSQSVCIPHRELGNLLYKFKKEEKSNQLPLLEDKKEDGNNRGINPDE